MDKWTALPLRIPKKRVAVARSAVQFWTFTMSNSKGRTDLGLARDRRFSMRRSGKPDLRAPPTRAQSRRAHVRVVARVVGSFDAHALANADARSRVISGLWLSVSLWAHRVPPACWRRVVARRRLVRSCRSLSGRFIQCENARV